MSFLNYHHLRYFRAIANEGSLTRAAERLNISQSAISIQLRSLEESLGQPLFHRQNKSLVLTEAGGIALDYAESIFRAGEEMAAVLKNEVSGRRRVLRIGAVATLSRNFQIALLRPLIGRADIELVLYSGNLRDLLAQLRAHTLDVVLSNLPVRRDADTDWHSHLLDEQPVSLVGKRTRQRNKFRFPEDLRTTPVLLPSLDSNIRSGFDLILERSGIRPVIAAEVDDMAMLRLLACEGAGLALVPPVVVRGELDSGLLVERHRITDLRESFYAITPSRRFPNPVLRELLHTKFATHPVRGGSKRKPSG
ncbi:MAG: LysR family transcriptional regulator [Chthoniobacter sp.]|uniref:LysR family transcriptional regulator n=1 Tax=Chthoniobacter sp. TaxID=2510640 RepID=UPI0032A571BF